MQQLGAIIEGCFLCGPRRDVTSKGQGQLLVQPSVCVQNCAGDKQKSYKIMRMNIFAVYDKVKSDTENTSIKGLNLAVVKLTTVKMTKLSL
jgi:hypothetical protein